MSMEAGVLDLATVPLWALWIFALAGLASVFGVAWWLLPDTRQSASTRCTRSWFVAAVSLAFVRGL
jgi:hypothetical protein